MGFRKLQTKILAGYILIVLIFTIIAGVSYNQIKDMERQVNQLVQKEFVFYQIHEELAFSVAERASQLRAYMLYKEERYVGQFDQSTKESVELENKLIEMVDSKESRELVDRNRAWEKYIRESIFPHVRSGDIEKAIAAGTIIAPETTALIEMNEAMANEREKNIHEISQILQRKQSTIVAILFTSTGIAILLALGLGFFMARSITKPIAKLVGISEKIARGDLNVEIDISSKDEVGILAKAFEKMTDNINEVIGNISMAAEQVATGSKQVSESSMTSSEGATEQASTIEELTASLEEISSQTQLNAQNAGQANEIAERAKLNAIEGNEQMQGMLKAMEEINDASGNISKIIKVIDEIAFQTNILALNAAVEAARAGQHGKGFAVVAEEVRNLAARSANAAKETTAMIEGSIKKVEGGTKIANETAIALNSIVEGVAKVAGLVNDIAMASNEQAAGISQINQGIMQVSEVVQMNSATAEEGAAASEELAGQAELLKEQVSRFRLKRGRRSQSFYNGGEEMDGDRVKTMENVNSQKKLSFEEGNYEENSKSGLKKIALSDKEFGKY
ncbi:MAG: methyl-accepting chemotaxis protein [Thermotaleaceae bacterium]